MLAGDQVVYAWDTQDIIYEYKDLESNKRCLAQESKLTNCIKYNREMGNCLVKTFSYMLRKFLHAEKLHVN